MKGPEVVIETSNYMLVAIQIMIHPWQRFAPLSTWDMMTVCGYLVAKEHRRLALDGYGDFICSI